AATRRRGLSTSCRLPELPLDGTTPMERPPLGGEGYQRYVDSLIDRFDVFRIDEKRAIR
ncbi:hypothetical protein A2U01_0116425, partial [Trifolium medium]|nr:hypothetical protein [Trifolium medium]